MTAATRWRHAAGGLLGVLALLGAPERGLAAAPAPAAWYVGAGGGPGWSAAMDKAGYNRDTTCSPNRDCGGRAVAGFRWFQDLVPAAGRTFEVTAGRRIGRLRIELSAAQQTHAAALESVGITYLDGSDRAPRIADSPYTSSTTNTVGDLTTRTLSLNVYRDLPLPGARATPYLGARQRLPGGSGPDGALQAALGRGLCGQNEQNQTGDRGYKMAGETGSPSPNPAVS
jgi:hypothetical protein